MVDYSKQPTLAEELDALFPNVCSWCCNAGYVYSQPVPSDDEWAKSQCRVDCPKCKPAANE